MALTINEKFLEGFVAAHEMDYLEAEATSALDRVLKKTGAGADFLGWVDLPIDYDKEEFVRIKAAAERIKKSCDILVVLGIGGSYLGARAVIEFVKSPLYNNMKKDTPDIYFSGNNISTTALCELLAICEGKDICINVISKSGTTTETAVAFRVFRDLLYKKYGEEGAKERIFVTTDRARGTLKQFADANGLESFVIPDDVGGRYSVLTAVGLLPVACAGVDIDALMAGAAAARTVCTVADYAKNPAMRYAAIRNALYRKGKAVEILVGYEPYALLFNEWWKQLFGESEGKDNKGLLPDSVIFSTDLHSLGQYVQDGRRTLFETVLNVKNCGAEFVIPADEENGDGLNFLAGKTLDYVNKRAMLGTLLAHNDGDVPNVLIEIEDRSEYSLGYLIYFFEMSCAISGYLLGVNPFDQPGVEAYKKNMFALLGKPGYEAEGEKLAKRLDF
ncbi:MAG: glucose-6-phosphate isomerase [Clostridia bacterium]|nr:glucose-6-phosphate isomerase [Clostridia bacterium]